MIGTISKIDNDDVCDSISSAVSIHNTSLTIIATYRHTFTVPSNEAVAQVTAATALVLSSSFPLQLSLLLLLYIQSPAKASEVNLLVPCGLSI